MTTPVFIYTLPEDNEKLDTVARQAGHKAVQDIYPNNIYRAREDQEGHARALCEQAREAYPDLTNDFAAYITRYAAAYADGYQDELKLMDEQHHNTQPSA